jgi:hypothetical protein
MSVENWNDIETSVLISSVSYFGVIYLISWIVIGNWILLDLVTAILLDGFDDDSSPKEAEKSSVETATTETEEEDEENDDDNDGEEKSIGTEKSFAEHYKSHDASLFLFFPSSPPRKLATLVANSPIFANIVLVVIILSSLKLAVDSYVKSGHPAYTVFSYLDIFFNCFFLFECVLKIIARGFFVGEGSYLRDNWCKLDFVIVCVSFLDMALVTIDMSVFRILRAFRPIRLVSRNL